MTLDTSKPNDTDLISELPGYIRENRVAINAIVGSDNFGVVDLEVAAGATSLTIGTELSRDGIELVVISGAGVATIATILGGTEGQVKIFVFQDANIDITDGNARALGVFYLNHLPAASDFDAQQDDVLVVANVGGDGAAVFGYWVELFRTISVK